MTTLQVGGLTTAEAVARLARDGPNELPAPPAPSKPRELVAQMVHFFALMLWCAGGLAIVAGMPQLGIAIFVVILVNGTFAFAQEYRAERAAMRLRDLLPRRATVVRDGLEHQIDVAELVVGDLVRLEAGDRISADLDALDAHGLLVDTSILTGESVPVPVEEGGRLYAGTFVVEGAGLATVGAIGSGTELARIAQLTRTTRRPKSPLAVELERVVQLVAMLAVAVGAGFFALALALGTPAADGFLFAIGVTVALVPEGLLPTVTLSLAVGAQRMAGHNALVRRLEAVETLGSTTFICTDKTGTLTRNEMSVVAVWTPAGAAEVGGGAGYSPAGRVEAEDATEHALRELAATAVACSTGRTEQRGARWVAVGDPMEAALWTFATRVGIDPVESRAREQARFPFDPRRRRMSVVVGGEVAVKGAPDAVLDRCRAVDGASVALEELAGRGLRVLAVARRRIAKTAPRPSSWEEAEADLELLGIVGIEDPPRASAAPALAACRAAGIRVAMVTGDHPATALAVAREVGLASGEPMVMAGADLPDDDQVLGALLDRDGVIVARVSPAEKLRIARVLQQRGHVVAMTGDGVNDGPALREADIGVAMGLTGSDVAREAADLVLLDDDFATIVAAVAQGRSTFANVRRFLTYHLTDNVAELTPFLVWALSGGRFPLAIGVLQILMLDIGTDLLPALALGSERPRDGSVGSEPRRGHLLDGAVLRRVFTRLGPTEAAVEMTAFVASLVASGWRPGAAFPTGHDLAVASGAAFTAVVLGQLACSFACRSEHRAPWVLGWAGNRLLLGAVAVELLVLAFVLAYRPLADLMDHALPSAVGAGVALLALPAVLGIDALDKAARKAMQGEDLR